MLLFFVWLFVYLAVKLNEHTFFYINAQINIPCSQSVRPIQTVCIIILHGLNTCFKVILYAVKLKYFLLWPQWVLDYKVSLKISVFVCVKCGRSSLFSSLTSLFLIFAQYLESAGVWVIFSECLKSVLLRSSRENRCNYHINYQHGPLTTNKHIVLGYLT